MIAFEPLHLGESKDKLDIFIMSVNPLPFNILGGGGQFSLCWFISFPTERVFNSRATGCHEMDFIGREM